MKKYDAPELEIVKYNVEDILTDSEGKDDLSKNANQLTGEDTLLV